MNAPETFRVIDGERAAVHEPDDFRPPQFSDESLALEFAKRNATTLRFIAKWNTWLEWDGRRWSEDTTLNAYNLVRAICREMAAGCNKQKTAAAIASAKTVAAVERLARSDRRLAATVDQWDAAPHLLNTPDCVIDLMTGQKRPHRPEDHITKITAVAPGGDCRLWAQFLNQITGADVAQFLGRVFGYGLTGWTREHAMVFFYGSGANGKSVLLNTVSRILGDYAQTAPIETFTASAFERHPTELASLRGARLVTATETEEGRRWAESKIKALTGGDKISARFMRQDFFEFTPTFKLVIAGNHKPGLRSVDEAIRRRFHLVPFNLTIPVPERDLKLAEKLQHEWPGILGWMIDGCLEWQRSGLCPPETVVAATEAYLLAEDGFGGWLTERCMPDADAWEKSSELFADFKAWSASAGDPPCTQRRFNQNLETRGYHLAHRNTGNGFAGLKLIPRMTGC